MKRRGVKPNVATYSTMMMGYGAVDDWSKFSKQLENCHAVHEHFFENRQSLDPDGSSRISSPTSKYFANLSKAGLHDKMFDVFNQMDQNGRWAPNTHVYGAMVAALNFRKYGNKVDGLTLKERMASEGKLLWRHMKEAESRGISTIDEYVISRLMSILSKGRPADQQLALDIAKEYAGLVAPGEEPRPPKVEMTPNLRLTVLFVLRKLGRSRLTMHYAEQLLESDSANLSYWGGHVLEAFNEIAITAPSNESEKAIELLKRMLLEAARRDSRTLRPTMHHYETALMVCWRCVDWPGACEVFTLMSGYSAADFIPRDPVPTPDSENANESLDQFPRASRSAGLDMKPTNLAMLNIVRTAVATSDEQALLQCWNMYAYFFGIKPPPPPDWNSYMLKPHLHSHYFNVTFAHVMKELIDRSVPLVEPSAAEGMESLRRWAQKSINLSFAYKQVVPFMEKHSSDSPDEELKMKQAIDFELGMRRGANRSF